nr:MAG: putative RNA-dependent RNA polymerase [Partitiviridae sp.]
MNLRFLQKIERWILPWRFEYKLPSEVTEHRFKIVFDSASKFYPIDEINEVLKSRRSDFSDSAVIENFKLTEQPFHDIPFDIHTDLAIETTRSMFQPSEVLYPISYPDLRYYPWTLPTSAEAPWNLNNFKFVPFQTTYDWLDEKWSYFKNKVSKYFTVKEWLRYKQAIGAIDNDSTNFHNLYNELFVYNRSLIHGIKYGSNQFWTQDGEPKTYYWNTLHARSHVVSENEPDKIRAVFGAPKLLLMAENMFIWQMQRVYLNNDEGRLLWGREMMKGGWKKLTDEINHQGSPNTVISIDWSQFDRRLLFSIIDIVHDIWRSYFDFNYYQATSIYVTPKPKDPMHIERLWKWMCHSIKFNPILLPNGDLYQWTYNGFGSGYQQTQLLDTFADCIMILTCLSSLGINVKSDRFWIRIQGDDSLVTFYERVFEMYGPLFLNMLADAAQFYFNAKLNVKKSMIKNRLDGITVLGYFNRYGLPYRTDEDLLRHLFFPEHDQDWTRLAATAMGLAMASCGCSLRFYRCCERIWYETVIKRGVKPHFNTLRWMERAGMIERTEALEKSDFPNFLTMRAEVWSPPNREESAKQRLWPTRPGPAGKFYFLSTAQKFA